MELPQEVTIGWLSRFQGERLRHATLLHYKWQSLGENEVLNKWEQCQQKLHQLYYWMHLPGWVWNNVCFAPGWKNFPLRVSFFFKKMLSRRSWQKV